MTCRKRRYKDQIAAKLAVATMVRRRHNRRDKDETRAYRCPECNGWHLTSKERKVKT